MKHDVMVSKLCTNKLFPWNLGAEGKFAAIGEEVGGPSVTAGPILQRLGHQVTLLGRCSAAAAPFRDLARSLGIDWQVVEQPGPGAVNAVLSGPEGASILRVVPDTNLCTPTREEGEYLSRRPLDAMVLAGSLPNEYIEFLLLAAAARDCPVFWNATPRADFDLIVPEQQVVLQVSHGEFGRPLGSAGAFAASLLGRSGAMAVIVTDAERGAIGLARDGEMLYAPAIPVPQPVRTCGAGDAFLAGLVSAWLEVPFSTRNRLERSLHLGRLTAARHVSGLQAGSWSEVAAFARQATLPAVRAA